MAPVKPLRMKISKDKVKLHKPEDGAEWNICADNLGLVEITF